LGPRVGCIAVVDELVKLMVVLAGCMVLLLIGRIAGPVVPVELIADMDIFEGDVGVDPLIGPDFAGDAEEEEEPRLSRFTRPPQISSFFAGVAG